ncbi:uncharacterized protein LOC110840825 [Zootermopsis nevadensis]|uniref:uncharacterized protein LOC110840825 n=1 Tax=Zootermopsis nevadensis TaxID=136037 RepID=UPI000B8EE36D|nr:uncharacterized protein LOC110840825 [Zootermopsis nevadensis]
MGFLVQNVIPMTAWRDKSPLSMHILELENVPQSHKILDLKSLYYIKTKVEPYKTRTVPPQCARCQQFYHVAASCQAPPACGYCSGSHCSWECTARLEPDFIPTCALCKIGDHSPRFRGCPFFQSLMDKEGRLNQKKATGKPPNAGPVRQPALPRPPSYNNRNFPAMRVTNAWNRPLVFGTQTGTPTHTSFVQPSNIPFHCQFIPNQVHSPAAQPRNLDPRTPNPSHRTCSPRGSNLAQLPQYSEENPEPQQPSRRTPSPSSEVERDGITTNISQSAAPKRTKTRPDTPTHPHRQGQKRTETGPQSLPDLRPPAQTNSRIPLPRQQRLGNSYTDRQTRDFVNIVRSFNPSFSFQCLLQSLTAMLFQFAQHPYESALPVIFNTFLTQLLGINYGFPV